MTPYAWFFLAMVFIAVFFLASAVIVPTFGTEASAAKRLRGRIRGLTDSLEPRTRGLLRERYLKQLSPLERSLESLPRMDRLAAMLDQAGLRVPAYRVVLLSVLLALAAAASVSALTLQPWYAAPAGLAAFLLPYARIHWLRRSRLQSFEAQLPEALDMLSRALRAGHPFTDALRMVGEEMPEPMGGELSATYNDLNYGIGMRDGFVNLLTRVPSLSLTAVVTAVFVQRETGGNLAEVLDKIAAVVRGRFRLHRRVRTLSAEGRLSAWVLTLVPFALAAVVSITTPTYLPMLLEDPVGKQMLAFATVAMVVGIFWVSRVIRIRI